jgi:hypothetical protein
MIWIADDYFDLIVWYESQDQIHGFQLCYDKPHHERAFTWTCSRGYLHTAIHSGESKPTANRTPTLAADGTFPVEQVKREFMIRGSLLPGEIRELVLGRIDDYATHQRD